MQIRPQSQSEISQLQTTEVPNCRIVGEYNVLKEKSKTEILSVSEKALMGAIEAANKAAEGSQHKFNFKLHEATGDFIIQVISSETREVLHEIPPEKLIDLVEKLKELAAGVFVDEKR